MDFFPKTDSKSLATVPVDAQNTNEKDLKYTFLSVLFIVFCRLCALAEKYEQRYYCLSVWVLKRLTPAEKYCFHIEVNIMQVCVRWWPYSNPRNLLNVLYTLKSALKLVFGITCLSTRDVSTESEIENEYSYMYFNVIGS